MVKIIGTDDTHVKHCSCKKCASKLEYTLSEVTYTSYTDYGGGTDAWNYIVCPKCNNKVEVKGY